MSDDKGFTFLELLLVLSIVVILSSVILPFSEKRLRQITEEDALKQFYSAVRETQLYAITHGESVSLRFAGEGRIYMARDQADELIFQESFPEGMRLGEQTKLKILLFSSTGMLQQTGKMTIVTKTLGTKTISFQFERGRMIINE